MRKLRNTELNRKTIEEFKKSKKTSAIVILDNIRSIHNVGSIFRTSDSFLIEKIIISGYTATPENSKMEKTALGSSDSVDWEYTEDVIETIQSLKNKGIKVVSVEQADKSLKIEKFTPEKGIKYAFVFGNEVDGVSDEIILESDQVLEIPQVGTKHSLNVSVAAGIILWDFYQKTEI
jgi:23S rRNA (guanosine2251-2'-O)-methyltransferase|tara:strand:+ start:158 stop:688 length:531 start_codon:yes stop_codon:yes gene_type:complete